MSFTLRPWEQLTQEDVNNLKRNLAPGTGCLTFILTVAWSVFITLVVLRLMGVLP